MWGCVILALKLKKSKRQRQAMLLDVLPLRLSAEINIDSVGAVLDHIYKLPVRLRDSLMVNRIRKGLELFEKRNHNGEVSSLLAAQSDIDSNRTSGSYARLNDTGSRGGAGIARPCREPARVRPLARHGP